MCFGVGTRVFQSGWMGLRTFELIRSWSYFTVIPSEYIYLAPALELSGQLVP